MLTNLSSIAHLADGGRWCVDTTRCNCCWCRRVCRGLVPGCWEPEAGWRVWRGYRSSVPVVEWCYTVEDLYNISTQYLYCIYTISSGSLGVGLHSRGSTKYLQISTTSAKYVSTTYLPKLGLSSAPATGWGCGRCWAASWALCCRCPGRSSPG